MLITCYLYQIKQASALMVAAEKLQGTFKF